MLAVWAFALIRTVTMAVINGATIWVVFTLLGFRSIWSADLLSSTLTILLCIAAFLYAANAVVWATNGSEMVLKMFRILVLIGIVAAFPAVNYTRIDLSFIDFRYAALSLGIFIITVLISRLLTGRIRVEKLL